MTNEYLIDATTAAETIATIAASPAAGGFEAVAFYLSAVALIAGLFFMSAGE